MGCNCRKSLEVKNIMSINTGNAPKSAGTTANVNERTDKKEKIRVLREMWEAAQKKKDESRNAETKNKKTENDDEK
jgi:hypothetical protein